MMVMMMKMPAVDEKSFFVQASEIERLSDFTGFKNSKGIVNAMLNVD